MRGATVVLLALLTRALNPCCRSFSLGDAERQNGQIENSENRAVKVRRALTFTARHTPITREGCLLKKCQSTHMVIGSVGKVDAFTIQTISRHPILHRKVLGEQKKLQPNQTFLGLHKAFTQSSHSCLNYSHVYLLLMKSMNSYCFYAWTNALCIMCELNINNHMTEMDYMCFKVEISMALEDQVDITDKLHMRTGAWYMAANFTESNESNTPRVKMFLPGVKPTGPAVKSLTGTFSKQKDDWIIPSLTCLCTTMHCRLILSFLKSFCMISLTKGKSHICTHYHCAVYQFIWTWSLQKQREFNQMDKHCLTVNMHTCTDTWKHKEINLLQWQICTHVLNRGLFHQWILRVLLITVSLFLIGQTAAVTYISYTQRYVFTQRVRNSNQSFLLLFTISWCSLSPLTITGQSTVGCSCKLHHTAFGITFVLCISCVLGKTIVVLMAFKATLPGSKWFGRLPHRLSVLVFTMSQILIFIFWFSSSFNLSMNCYQNIPLEYDVLSGAGFCSCFYHLGVSFILTFFTCNLPFTMACYSVLNIHAIMGVAIRISLRALLR